MVSIIAHKRFIVIMQPANQSGNHISGRKNTPVQRFRINWSYIRIIHNNFIWTRRGKYYPFDL